MDAKGIELEDGEVSDDEVYIPLERPVNYAASVQPMSCVPKEVESEEEELESSSDSNSDCDVNPKRPKIKPKIKTIEKNSTRKKYDIWCSTTQEEVLAETLVNCDVSHIDRSRNVETYLTRKTNKRNSSDRNNLLLRPNKRTNFGVAKQVEIKPRIILDLNYTATDSEEDISRDIANKLCEEKEDLIKVVVEIAGKEMALELFKETQRVEEDGGMLILGSVELIELLRSGEKEALDRIIEDKEIVPHHPLFRTARVVIVSGGLTNQSRRRTPGGVFFYLVKNHKNLSDKQLENIFNEDKLKLKIAYRTNKRTKMEIVKRNIKAAGGIRLKDLLSSRELALQSTTKKETTQENVKTPPPSPVTDCFENSTDGTEKLNHSDTGVRSLVNYEDDCIDIGVNMDLI